MVPDYGYWLLTSIVFSPGKVWYHANGLVYKENKIGPDYKNRP